MKIQSGGLAGLQRYLQGATGLSVVENIAALITDAEHRYGDFSAIPFTDFVQDIIDFKLRRRR
jgi:hypothetical protein